MMTLQRSFKANTEIDQVFENIYNSHLYDFKIRNFKEDNDKSIIGNDELFYNYPNVNIPTIGVGRNMYREYHLNSDNLENLSLYNLEQSVWILYRSLLALEKNVKVIEFHTSRPGWAKTATANGFKLTSYVYKKEV